MADERTVYAEVLGTPLSGWATGKITPPPTYRPPDVPAQAPGGFLEPYTADSARPMPSVTLPSRGPFTFPAPYNSQAIRITNGSDMGNQDGLFYCGYSYWMNMNAHGNDNSILICLCIDKARGGGGPSLWRLDKQTLAVTFLGPLFASSHPLSNSTAEGWYWSRNDPALLYANDITHLYRFNVQTGALQTVIDVNQGDSPIKGKVLGQWHTANDDTTHSATLKNASTYQAEGVIVYREAVANHWTVIRPNAGTIDECQLDQSGGWLLTKVQLDNKNGEDNLIHNLSRMDSWQLLDEQGAAGHSDNGFGYMVAADNWANQSGAIRLWMLEHASQPQGLLVYQTPFWGAEMTHVSHCNAKGASHMGQYCVGSGASRTLGGRNNEIVAFPLDGTATALVIAPVMVNLDASGGAWTAPGDYGKLPKGNVDITGEYFLWTSNWGGSRLDAFIVRVPHQLLAK